MAKRKKKQKNRQSGTPSSGNRAVGAKPAGANGGTRSLSLEDARKEITALIASGKSKAAVDMAKLLHKQAGSPESEAMLGEAYAARVQSLIDKGMGEEARALLDMVRARFPNLAGGFEGLARNVKAQSGALDELLRELAQPGLPAEERRTVEDVLRRNLTDLQSLAQSNALPPEHPLRCAAQAAWVAFQAVTTGPVSDEVFALPEISRRSPLAPWKSLIRAIACYYRRDDAQCRQHCAAIDPETPPARLVAVLTALMDSNAPQPTSPRAKLLMKRVSSDYGDLRRILEKAESLIDKAHYAADDPNAMSIFRSAAKASTSLESSLAARIRRHMWIKAHGHGFLQSSLDEAITPLVLRDAAFWACLAQVETECMESGSGNPFSICAAWDEFISQAVQEGMFEAKSSEAAAVYDRMLALLAQFDEDELDDCREFITKKFAYKDFIYAGQPASVKKGAAKTRATAQQGAYYFYPERIFERIEEAAPTPLLYKEWLYYYEQRGNKNSREKIAMRWAATFPRDAEPRLYLMEMAEKRKAFKKALSWLEKAEAVDALNPEVRRARFRLLLGAFERHVRQRKLHLAAADLDAVEGLPVLGGQDRRALEAALRAVLNILERQEEQATHNRDTAAKILDDELTAEVLCWSTAKYLGVVAKHMPPLTKAAARLPKGRRGAALARAISLGKAAGLILPVPAPWKPGLIAELRDRMRDVDPAHLQGLAEALLEAKNTELAYYTTCGGILRDGPHLPRFLLLRAKCLPKASAWRRGQCLTAAIVLARNQRDLGVIDEAVDLLSNDPFFMHLTQSTAGYTMAPEHLRITLAEERREKKAPLSGQYSYAYETPYFRRCTCDACKAARHPRPFGRPFPGMPFVWDDDDDDDDDDAFDFDDPDVMEPGLPDLVDLPEALQKDIMAMLDRLTTMNLSPIEMEEAVSNLLLDFTRNQEKSKPKRSTKQIDLFEDDNS